MKILKLKNTLNGPITFAATAAFVTLLAATQALAGAGSSGGGIYGKVNGKWVLLDELEEGTLIYPGQSGNFPAVEQKLKEVESTVPEFAPKLRNALTAKTWHLVPFELRCEDPNTPLKTEESVGACQDEHDVWIEEEKFKSVDQSKLIVHELIQSVRLELNASQEAKIPTANVRALYRTLYRSPLPSETELLKKLAEIGFGSYQTRTELEYFQKRNTEIKLRQKTIERLAEDCRSLQASYAPKMEEAKARAPIMALIDGDSPDAALSAATEMAKFYASFNEVYNSMIKNRSDIRSALWELEYKYAIPFSNLYDLKNTGAKCNSAMKQMDQEMSTFFALLDDAKARLRK
jgi:hypothetical protein